MSGQLSFVPTSLPPGLYDQASGKFDAVVTHTTGSSLQPSPSTNRFPVHPLQHQYTGGLQSQGRGPAPSIPPRLAVVPGPNVFNQSTLSGAPPAPPWAITPEEKVKSDYYFLELDTTCKGYIGESVTIPFMKLSQLPGADVHHIWYTFAMMFNVQYTDPRVQGLV